MKTPHWTRPLTHGLSLGAIALALTACGGGSTGTEGTASIQASSGGGGAPAPLAAAASTEGRLLASNCFQCHGTGGTGGFEDIRGESAEELIEFLSKPAGKNIMAAHAQGYTTAQLKKIAAYLQR